MEGIRFESVSCIHGVYTLIDKVDFYFNFEHLEWDSNLGLSDVDKDLTT
jgi:hypothetical protein